MPEIYPWDFEGYTQCVVCGGSCIDFDAFGRSQVCPYCEGGAVEDEKAVAVREKDALDEEK